MSKVYCQDCNSIFLESEVGALHKYNNYTGHKIYKENESMKVTELLLTKIKELEKKLDDKFEESKKIEAELAFKIQENRSAIHMFRSENRIMKLCPKFELLNCKYSTINEPICEIYRIKNIVYMKIEFNGNIEDKIERGRAKIAIKFPMWLIYSGSFNIETLNYCLKNEEGKENDKNVIKSLCARYQQKGNELTIDINRDEFDTPTYWEKNKYKNSQSTFTINGNFIIQPPQILNQRKYYIYNIFDNKILCEVNNSLELTDKWESGCKLEICEENETFVTKINGKYLNINNGFIKLENSQKTNLGLNYLPGFADMTIISLLDNNKKVKFLEVKEGKIILGEELNEKCQFILIPELKEYKKDK